MILKLFKIQENKPKPEIYLIEESPKFVIKPKYFKNVSPPKKIKDLI
jgi:hypothetical protein